MVMNVCGLVSRNASLRPHSKAIICGDDGRIYNWSEFEKMVTRFSNALASMGVEKGDRVAIYLPNSPEFLFTYFAVARIGAIAVPFNILFRSGEITYVLNNSRAKVLVGASAETREYLAGAGGDVPHLEKVITVGERINGSLDFHALVSRAPEAFDVVDCSPDDIVSILYTSGTTGQPKGAMHSHGNLMAIGTLSSRILRIDDQDVLLTPTPFCHICFVLSALGPLSVGACSVTMRRFSPDKALELISRYRVTHFTGVPTMFIYMLHHFEEDKYDLTSWKYAYAAGASMPVQYIKEVEEKFGVEFAELYGLTETTSTVTYNRIGHGKKGSVGLAAEGTEVKLVDEAGNQVRVGEVGEILVKGPGVFKGYWEMPEATREVFDGEWYRTGDLGKYDEEGYLYIVGRKKEMIVCGGYNVYPREIEDVICQHPKVAEAAVVGVRDSARNEIPKAFVRLNEGEEMTEQELIEFCAQRIASYKVPRQVEFVPELPKSPSGKILKRLLPAS
ncbi:MAG: long-chain-fatty-acid--CoA ligase [Syntrophothermus sp.]|uniref:class I adenylate-forming enzyme family protein n=1 Tax=Syntrophothermus sp. TaxID=2736299 RepID=UPI00257ED797|nr:long-chain-fatty-acid--CoA ligase [Syntrophothermus sp.]NSW82940.1 long-chain-fatty-acid--CoA ligase [Syntrophothermus sp.]